ncbi:tetratricopeptide TPR_2 [Chitinispirillum alkaliphilum]|nr:tetratricopeptide TPR_2 [Chitinispirillum alkaliphilum]
MLEEGWLDLSDLVDRVQDFIDLGLFQEAKSLLEKYETAFENEWEIHFLYSRLYSEQDKPKKAIEYLKRALEIDPTNADCLLGLFYAYTLENNVKVGGSYLLKAEKLYSQNHQVLIALIYYYVEINNPEKALTYFNQVKTKGTDNPEAFRNGGCAFNRLGRFEEAETCFKTALHLSPQFDEVRDLLTDQYVFTGKVQEAIDLYRASLEESPRNIHLMSRLIFCLAQNNQLDEAIATAKQSIQFYPNSPTGYIDLAYVYLNNNNVDQALIYADKAIDIAPIDSEAYRLKGIAYSELGKTVSAEKFFKHALSLEPENSEILRDYYNHLRTSDEEKMLKIISKVIDAEYPYCTEEFWFLADYYRDKGKNLKAFHFFNKAYKTMPAEKELIPPMIDILLDQGHTEYSLSFLYKYMEKSGWDEILNRFSEHRQLRGKWSQESMRLLRFLGQRPIDFRKWVFRLYIIRFLILTLSIVFLFCFSL